MPSLSKLLDFLKERCQMLEAMTSEPFAQNNGALAKPTIKNRATTSNNARSSKPAGQHAYVGVESTATCPVCDGEHAIDRCDSFLKMSPNERSEAVRRASLCYNCMRRYHRASECKSGNCRKCQRRHHTLLHANAPANEKTASETPAASAKSMQVSAYDQVLLSTAVVEIADKKGNSRVCRVLLDSGSQANFITEDFAKQLGLNRDRIDLPITGLNEMATRIKHSMTATIKSKITDFSTDLRFLIITRITDRLPAQRLNKDELKIPRKIKLADPEFNRPSEIQALLGAEIFYKLLCVGQVNIAKPSAVLQKTKLGWIISGRIQEPKDQGSIVCNLATNKLEKQVSKFWETEELSATRLLSDEEAACELHFRQNVTRDENGRYVVRLPFNAKREELADSYQLARKRFVGLEKRLQRDKGLREQYHSFMAEYSQLGHMTAIADHATRDGYVLPHHPVIKDASLTTKTRVVFDASAKSSSGTSLNDTLLVGPVIQDDIFSLILRFRMHAYVLTADIEKMYRQVLVHPDDRKYQQIIWRDNVDSAISTYRLNTLTYGTSSAPFLATRCLQQLADDEGAALPTGARVLKRDFYVDDLLTGADTLDQAAVIRDEIMELTRRGGFVLRKWASNEPALIREIQDRAEEEYQKLDIDATLKALGIYWNAGKDEIAYKVQLSGSHATTKRNILSQIAQLFDPLGLLGPVIIVAKMLMQELWLQKVQWDEALPQDIYTRWHDYYRSLRQLSDWQLPRRVKKQNATQVQLHGFCDASERAYGACVYLRATYANGQHSVRLLCAKSRVAPLKTISLPRLELCGALLLSRLYRAVKKALAIDYDGVYMWSDSTITLSWLKTSPHTLKVFVANRVAEVREATLEAHWRHVPSADNPADYISRGQAVSEFMSNEMWLNGPAWLHKGEERWPAQHPEHIDIPERRGVTSLATRQEWTLFSRISSFATLRRIIAYCLRFISHATKRTRVSGPLTARELKEARTRIIRSMQATEFAKEIAELANNKQINGKSKLLRLNPFVDSSGILRVGGRIKHATLTPDQKHPAILPKAHPVTRLIIREVHERGLHAGANATLYTVRHNYWPLDGRNTTRKIVRDCVRCARVKPSEPIYIMGNLPKARVTASRPFINVGVDFCGPFMIKEKRLRNRSSVKVYVAVFVCLSVKAVHLDLVHDLTSEAFIACLRRFFARRGKAKAIHSDNATNFVGADRELRERLAELRRQQGEGQVFDFLAEHGIEWHFIPPRTPHFGGLWESAVKSLKHHLRRTVGDNLLASEQLYTLLTEIEAILNSRPIVPLSSDPNDLVALTPAHFLIGDSLITLPEHDFSVTPANRLSALQHVQRLKQHFWRRWHKEYLSELNERNKWSKNGDATIKIGDLVTLREDNLPPLRWALGRVVELHPGEDGVNRVATVKTANGTFKRGLKKLSRLPVSE